MFLKPTAKPIPRRTPSPRVVLPAPPGSRIGSRGSASAAGGSSAAAARITSAVGSEHSIRWPVGRMSPGRERVPQPQLDRVEPEPRGEPVHLRLGGEAGLDGAEAAHRAAGRVVRVDDRRLEPGIRDVVGAAGEGGGVRADGRRARRVGAAVEKDAHLDADEPAVPGGGVARPGLRRVAVDVAGERLLAAVDDLHRRGSCAARAGPRGSASRRPRARRRRRRRRRGGRGRARAAARGRGRSGRGRRGATGSRRRCRCRPRRRARRAPTPARGRPGPGCRSRRPPRRRPRPRRPGSPCDDHDVCGRRSAAGRRGSRDPRSGAPGGGQVPPVARSMSVIGSSGS